jgi:hypothetical protein
VQAARAIEPGKCLIGLPAIGEDLGDVVRIAIGKLCDEVLECRVGRCAIRRCRVREGQRPGAVVGGGLRLGSLKRALGVAALDQDDGQIGLVGDAVWLQGDRPADRVLGIVELL